MDFWIVFKIIPLLLLAATKFLMSPFAAKYGYDYGFIEAYTITTVGGLLGVLMFGLIGKLIGKYWSDVVHFFKRLFLGRNYQKKPTTLFNKTNRFIVNVKNRFGLIGVAFVTPCIISIPIGTIVAFSIYKHQPRKVWTALSVSLILWSFIINSVAQFTQIKL